VLELEEQALEEFEVGERSLPQLLLEEAVQLLQDEEYHHY
jgi:hypothetical protein